MVLSVEVGTGDFSIAPNACSLPVCLVRQALHVMSKKKEISIQAIRDVFVGISKPQTKLM